MSELHLVGVDLGLTELRTTAYDRRGTVALASTADCERRPLDGWETALREAAVYLPQSRLIVSAVGTSGTVVTVDEYGNQVFSPQWYSETNPEQAARIAALPIATELSEKGVPLSASSPLAKLLALRDRNPDRFDRIEWILSPATWLLYRLHYEEGEPWRNLEMDWTNALKFGADITRPEPRWSRRLFEAVDLPLDCVPEIVAPGASIGRAESQLAADVGLADAELYQGLTDGNASVLAAGCLQPGDCSIICGSTSVVKYVSEEIAPHDALYYHRHPIDGYLPGAAFDTGVVLEWLCETVMGIDVETGLELARSVEPGTEPRAYLQGDRSPFFDPNVGTTLFDLWPEEGASREEARGRLVRGIATGIALSEYTYFPLFEDHFDDTIDRIHLVSGGDARATDPFGWWNTLRASIWDRDVRKMEPRTTVGPLIPASLEASVYADVEAASDALLRSSGRIEPDEAQRGAYAAVRNEFADNWRAVRGLYETLDE